jgi:hypothetical protein
VTEPSAPARAFVPAANIGLTEATCFVLTPAGLALCLEGAPHNARPGHEGAALVRAGEPPRWDADLKELRLSGVLVKAFRRPAPNQETVLAAFQEEGWPPRIDDPIPRRGYRDSVQCLHDTVNHLNRAMLRPLLRFRGDGSGRGVRWDRAGACGPDRHQVGTCASADFAESSLW